MWIPANYTAPIQEVLATCVSISFRVEVRSRGGQVKREKQVVYFLPVWSALHLVASYRVLGVEIFVVCKRVKVRPWVFRVLVVERKILGRWAHNTTMEELAWTWILPSHKRLMSKSMLNECVRSSILPHNP